MHLPEIRGVMGLRMEYCPGRGFYEIQSHLRTRASAHNDTSDRPLQHCATRPPLKDGCAAMFCRVMGSTMWGRLLLRVNSRAYQSPRPDNCCFAHEGCRRSRKHRLACVKACPQCAAWLLPLKPVPLGAALNCIRAQADPARNPRTSLREREALRVGAHEYCGLASAAPHPYK